MYDINTKNVKKGRNFFIIFLVGGIISFIAIGFGYIYNVKKAKGLDSETMSINVEVDSYVDSDGDRMYTPIYYYRVGEHEYSCKSNSSSNISAGKANKKIYYDSENPARCMAGSPKTFTTIILLAMLIPIILIVVAVINMRKISKRIKMIKELNQKGKLVKNLPYRLEKTNISVNDVQILRPVVDYTLPSGSIVTLQGDPRHDRKVADADGMVDLVIDENDPSNYFIDFEINRLSGNLPSDYYSGGVKTNEQNVQNYVDSITKSNLQQ